MDTGPGRDGALRVANAVADRVASALAADEAVVVSTLPSGGVVQGPSRRRAVDRRAAREQPGRDSYGGGGGMDRDGNMAADERLGVAINGQDLDAIEAGFAVDAVDHDPAPGQAAGAAGFRWYFATLFAAFPDLRTEADSVVADDQRVALAYRLIGTHRGPFLGLAPTGRHVEIRGVQIARYRDGRIVERWGSSDQLGLLHQLRTGGPVSG